MIFICEPHLPSVSLPLEFKYLRGLVYNCSYEVCISGGYVLYIWVISGCFTHQVHNQNVYHVTKYAIRSLFNESTHVGISSIMC